MKHETERYLNGIRRRLKLDRKTSGRVISDLREEIHQAEAGGESLEAILARMGSAEAVAAEYRRSFLEDQAYRAARRMRRCRTAALACGAVFLGMLCLRIAARPLMPALGIIGGADGPTQILVSAAPALRELFWQLPHLFLPLSLAGILVSLLCYFLTRRKKTK